MKIFLHLSKPGDPPGTIQEREVPQIPSVGEYLTLDVTEPWHQVVLVVHTPSEDADCVAELYAVQVDALEILKRAFPRADR